MLNRILNMQFFTIKGHKIKNFNGNKKSYNCKFPFIESYNSDCVSSLTLSRRYGLLNRYHNIISQNHNLIWGFIRDWFLKININSIRFKLFGFQIIQLFDDRSQQKHNL